MAVDILVASRMVVAGVNAANTYTHIPDDPRFYPDYIRDAVLSSDGLCIEAGLRNPTWGRRKDFFSNANVPHCGQVPSHIGPIESVMIGGKAATLGKKSKIERVRANRLGLTLATPLYCIEGSTIYHTGAGNASVTFCVFIKGVTCQSPDEYLGAVVRGALSIVFNVEGEDPSSAGMYGSQFALDRQMITSGEIPPEFVLNKAA